MSLDSMTLDMSLDDMSFGLSEVSPLVWLVICPRPKLFVREAYLFMMLVGELLNGLVEVLLRPRTAPIVGLCYKLDFNYLVCIALKASSPDILLMSLCLAL